MLAPNTLYQGNALELIQQVDAESIPLVLTDIPYGVVNRESAGIRNFDKEEADVCDFELKDLVDQLVRVSSGSIYVFCGTEQVSELRQRFVDHGLTTRLGIWEKTNPSPVNGEHLWLSGIETCVFARKSGATFNLKCANTVWRFPTGKSNVHPTEKPQALFEFLIRASSKEGDVVLDPFCGSGTTAAAALRSKRQYLVFEREAKWCSEIETRIANNQSNVLFA